MSIKIYSTKKLPLLKTKETKPFLSISQLTKKLNPNAAPLPVMPNMIINNAISGQNQSQQANRFQAVALIQCKENLPHNCSQIVFYYLCKPRIP